MDVAILGTGMVGRALAGRLDELGHTVTMGTRDVEATRAREAPDTDTETPSAWLAHHPGVRLETFREATAEVDLVVAALHGDGVLAALEAAGEDHLAGRVLLDVSNPLDFSAGFPPTLSVCNTDSLAEQVQRRFPDARVVKSLNTVNAAVMVDPGGLADGDHTVFVSGDENEARSLVTGLLEEFGWNDVLDLGPLSTARGTEMYLALWLRLMGAVGTPRVSIRVVR